jgi:hypothetical protein
MRTRNSSFQNDIDSLKKQNNEIENEIRLYEEAIKAKLQQQQQQQQQRNTENNSSIKIENN